MEKRHFAQIKALGLQLENSTGFCKSKSNLLGIGVRGKTGMVLRGLMVLTIGKSGGLVYTCMLRRTHHKLSTPP